VILVPYNTLVSSANIIVKILSDIEARSLIYNKNRKGPRMNPWGTPQFIIFGRDFTPLKCTY
jgi:hypothetical protein